MRRLLVPKNFLATTLAIIFLLSFLQFSPLSVLQNLFLAVGTTVVADVIFLKIRKITLFFPSATIVSGLIIALLISPASSFLPVVIAAIFAMFLKNFLRIKNRHIFNPAASGILLASLVFKEPLSWWGVSWGVLPLMFTLLLVGYLVFFRMRRFRILLSFLIVYFLLLRNFVFDPTIIFFSLVMLPEPMTSPAEPKKQILYGIFVAIAVFAVGGFIGQLQLDPLIISLLLGNLLFRFI